MKSLSILKADRTATVSELKKLKQLKQDALAPQIAALEEALINYDQQIKTAEELEKKAKGAAKAAEREEKQEETEQEKAIREYAAFQHAIKVYEETGMCFHRASPPRYFHKNVYIDIDIKTQKERRKSEIEFYSMDSMKDNWIELQNESARKFLRKFVEGGEVSICNPDSGELETFSFPRRVYSKLGNTRHIPDEKTYNMIDFGSVMKPTNLDNPEAPVECPSILKALMYSLAGAKFHWDSDGKVVCDKEDAVDWLERWIYGVVHADIGNNMLSMPIYYGKGKRGRNALCDLIIPEILGQELCFSGTWSTIDSGFNAFKLGKVFVYIDEVPPREEWNKLKALTGSPYDYVKQKYGPEFMIENTTAFCIGTNEPSFPLPFEDGEQMMRVSPINCANSNTFALNTYLTLEHEQPGLVKELLENIGAYSESNTDDYFMQGDTVLRQFGELWRTRDVVQQFLDYLHHRYHVKESGIYTLMPLRGRDWQEIANTKSSPLTKTVEFIGEHKVDHISLLELHEIYKIVVGKKDDKFVKQISNFSTEIWPAMEEAGWLRKQQCRVKVLKTLGQVVKDNLNTGSKLATVQTTLYYKQGADTSGYTVDLDRFVTDVQIGGTAARHLRYKDEISDYQMPALLNGNLGNEGAK